MVNDPENVIQYHRDIVERIFVSKECFHREQARLPIEEKIKILVELQKIVLHTRPAIGLEDNRQLWDIEEAKTDSDPI